MSQKPGSLGFSDTFTIDLDVAAMSLDFQVFTPCRKLAQLLL